MTTALAIHGGAPACTASWPTWPQFDQREEQALLGVLRSGSWWFGDHVQQFENEFAEFQGAHYAVSCTNGTTAIEMALRAMGVVEGDEVIVPPYSFIATASAVVTIGAVPVFADIETDSLCLDPEDVARKLTARTRAIVPVHVAGRMANMPRILEIADRARVAVLEDAAHAWGSELAQRGAGTWGAAGTFSFQETKNITAGEGGLLVTQDEALADACRSFSHCGRVKNAAWYDHDVLGSNLRMTEFQAAILQAQLTRLPSQVARREITARRLEACLNSLDGLVVPPPPREMTRRSYHMLIFRVDAAELGASRDAFLRALQAEGVPASAGWYRPLYRNKLFQDAHCGPAHGIRSPLAAKGVRYTDVHCPVCEAVCQDAVWIPHHVLLASDDAIEQLCVALEKVAAQAERLEDEA